MPAAGEGGSIFPRTGSEKEIQGKFKGHNTVFVELRTIGIMSPYFEITGSKIQPGSTGLSESIMGYQPHAAIPVTKKLATGHEEHAPALQPAPGILIPIG